MGTLTPNYQLQLPTIGGDAGPQWAQEINGSISTLDTVLGGVTTVSVTAGNNIALTTTQIQNNWIKLTGTPTVSTTVQFPSGVGGRWIVSNNTTGTGSVSVQTIGGVVVAIPQGLTFILVSDGTNIQFPAANGWQELYTIVASGNQAQVFTLPVAYRRFRLGGIGIAFTTDNNFLAMQFSLDGVTWPTGTYVSLFFGANRSSSTTVVNSTAPPQVGIIATGSTSQGIVTATAEWIIDPGSPFLASEMFGTQAGNFTINGNPVWSLNTVSGQIQLGGRAAALRLVSNGGTFAGTFIMEGLP